MKNFILILFTTVCFSQPDVPSEHWLDDKSINQFELLFTEKAGKFMDHLNLTCYTSLKSFESHYDTYDKKSNYKRYIDQFKNEHRRKFSEVLYINQDRKEEE